MSYIKFCIILISLIFINCSSLSILKETPLIHKKIILLDKSDTFIPKKLKDTTSDFISSSVENQINDTLIDSSLFNSEDPIFAPVVLDSGILLCMRDIALYINDNSMRKYLEKELETRKKFERELIISSIKAEKTYQETLYESINNYNLVYGAYLEERKQKGNWRLISTGVGLVLVTFLTSVIILN